MIAIRTKRRDCHMKATNIMPAGEVKLVISLKKWHNGFKKEDLEEIMKAYQEFWTKMFVWRATATRKQYWIPVIVNYLIGGILMGIVEKIQGHNIEDIYNLTDLSVNTTVKVIGLLVWVATLTIQARRLHDTNRSAGWIFIQLVPVIGTVWFFVLMLLPTATTSRWHDNQSYVY